MLSFQTVVLFCWLCAMGESVLDEFHCERSEPTPDSKTSRLHILERCTELVCADDEKVEGKCGHFSIR